MSSIFDSIRHLDEHQGEYWLARELAKVLEYEKWERFEGVIIRAIEACKNTKQKPQDHFPRAGKMVSLGSGSQREVSDYHLSRYACYLIAQNGDPRKEKIAQAQSYFAIQTRRQELSDQLLEDQKRVTLRNEMTTHNKNLAKAAKQAGVWNYGEFTDSGYGALWWSEK